MNRKYDKYLQMIQKEEVTAEQTIQFIRKKFSVEPQDPNDRGYFVLEFEKENCRNIVDDPDYDDFEFEAFALIENSQSQSYYNIERENMERSGEEWPPGEKIVVLIEKKTGYIQSNCHGLWILLELQKGISRRDYQEKNDHFYWYLELLDQVLREYSKEELKEIGIAELFQME